MKILGIETSCDETGVAIYDEHKGLIAEALYSQVDLHAKYGGVVPELASRDHIRKLLPLIKTLFAESSLSLSDINAIGYTAGPGLIGALLVGAMFAKSLAYGLHIPCIPIHHMEAHLLAALMCDKKPSFPFLALLVSGGHTLLVDVKSLGHYKILGETIDDAVGEAFDKTAKLLGLPYPGGKALSDLAKKGKKDRFQFPRPMMEKPGLDFSFSGLKTFAVNTWLQSEQKQQTKADIAYAFQHAVVETLVGKCKRALKQTGLRQLVVAGGVGANQLLRQQLKHLLAEFEGQVFFPPEQYCTDNGAMIAFAAFHRFKQHHYDKDLALRVFPRWSLEDLQI